MKIKAANIVTVFIGIMLLTDIYFCKAQNGTEWIVEGQSYYKINTHKDGLYVIPYSQLPGGINTTDLTNLQLWFRGKEQAIYLNNDTVFFYGKRNDGTLDSLLYLNNFQPHKYFNIHSDTCAYFLTMGASPGKRIILNTSNPSGASDSWYYQEQLMVFTDNYYSGQQYGVGPTTLSDYDQGEGFFGNTIQRNNSSPSSANFTIPISNSVSPVYSSGQPVYVKFYVQVAGVNNAAPHVVTLTVSSGNNTYPFSFNAFGTQSVATLVDSIPASSLSGQSQVTFTIQVGVGSFAQDWIAPTYIRLLYPRSYNGMNNSVQKISLANNGNQARSISINNSPQPKVIIDNTDPYNQQFIGYTNTSNSISLNLPPTSQQLILYDTSYLSVSGISSVDLTLADLNAEYYIVYPLPFSNSAEEYRIYRNSPQGGSYASVKLSFDQLCNLYSYGEFTSLALKRFCTDLQTTSIKKYLLILGKGLTPSASAFIPVLGKYIYYRTNPAAFWNSTDVNTKFFNFIPPFGDPGSDLMYSIDNNYIFQIPTGRVPVQSDAAVIDYLNKVKSHESLDSTSLWRKNLVHLSGGDSPNQVTQFLSYVNNYKSIVEGPYFGGKVVKTFVKNLQVGAVDDQLKSSIATEVNLGISMLTFFGHGSNTVNDVDIGLVSDPIYGYGNEGMYPFLLLNGCSTADIYNNYSTAEDWINTANKGAVNIIGESDLGFTDQLNTFTTYFYHLQFDDLRYRNLPIGNIQQKVVDSIQSNLAASGGITNNYIIGAQGVQMNMIGDPAVRLYPNSNPDYAIYGDVLPTNVSPTSSKCTLVPLKGTYITSTDDFNIIIPVTNYGKTPPANKKVVILIKRVVNNVTKTYETILTPVYYQDTIIYNVKYDGGNYNGLNEFTITVDIYDSLTEMTKTNNVATLSYFMASSAVQCLYPLNYSVVSNQPVTLIAQPTNLLIPQKEYYFEIDTTKNFNSPFKQTGTVLSGSLPSWTPTLIDDKLPSDSIVYFWRVRFDTIPAQQDTLWDYSSFIYIKNSNPGWSQTKVAQFLEDELNGLSYTNKWTFPPTSVILNVTSDGNVPGNAKVFLNKVQILYPNPYFNSCNGGGLLAMVLDKSSLQPKSYSTVTYCGIQYGALYMAQFTEPFLAVGAPAPQYTNQGYDAFISYLNGVDPNDYIIVFNDGTSWKSLWNPVYSTSSILNNYFKNTLHADSIYNLTGDHQPFVLLTQRTTSNPLVVEKYNENSAPGSTANLIDTIQSYYSSGSITSTLIGPSSKWGNLYFAIDTAMYSTTSPVHAQLKLIRYNISGIAVDTVNLPKKDSLNLNGAYLIDGTHVYCKLLLQLEDTSTLVPAILKKWQVIYNGVPEGTLNPYALGLDLYQPQTKQEGDTLTMTYRFDNISNVDFTKPLKVVFTIRNASGSSKVDTVTYTTLAALKDLTFTYKFSTRGMVGQNYLQVYVNPQIQPEQYYSNNILETSFTVTADLTQPVLQVSFDGVQIFNGDLVSASPLINISLRDNNKYLLLTNPNSIKVFLLYPNGTQVQIMNTDPMVLEWNLANAQTNTFVAELKPTSLPDGLYTLIVQGSDASNNAVSKYSIQFTVNRTPSITYFYPYPNPFSTSTRFVFTLTGTTVPDQIEIEIMTVTGVVVKQIFKEQLGNIHIGNNISDYAWDGTDEHGSRLANGVYLYRAIIKDQTQNFQHSSTGADKAFHNDWGKMYILR